MSKDKISYKKVLSDKNFRKLFFATVISRFGDSLDAIAYAFMVFELTGSAVLIAVLYAVNGIPSFLLNMFTGVAVAYLPKKKVVYISDGLRGCVVLLTAILYYQGSLEVWHLYLFTLISSSLEAFRAPAGSALYRLIVKDENMEHSTALYTSGRTFAEMIGIALAAFLIGFIGVSGAIIVDAVTFFISAFIITTISKVSEVKIEHKLTVKQYFVDFKEGFVYVVKSPLIKSLALFVGSISFFFAPFNALQAVYVLETLELDIKGLSVMGLPFMIAMMIGSLLIPTITKKIGAKNTFIVGGIVVGLGYFMLALIAPIKGQLMSYILLGSISFVMGSTVSFISVPIQVALFKKVDPALLTRVFAFISMLSLASIPLGGAAVGGLVNFFRIETLFYGFGIAVMILFFLQIFNKAFRELDEKVEEAA